MSKSEDKKQRKRRSRVKEKLDRERMRQIESRLERTFRSTEQIYPGLVSDALNVSPQQSRRVMSIALARRPLREKIIPNLFPRNFAELGTKRRRFSGLNAHDEIRLALSILIYHRQEVNYFVGSKDVFESKLLLGDTAGAREERSAVVRKLGVSLWSIETELLLGEMERGVKGNREALSELQDAIVYQFIHILTSYLTQRIESTESVPGYESALHKFLSDMESHEIARSILSEIEFRLNYHKFKNDDCLGEIVEFSREYSICDIYLTFVRVLIVMMCLGTKGGYAPLCRELLADAIGFFDDPTLTVLYALAADDVPLNKDGLADKLIEICDQYTVGDYATALANASTQLHSHPCCFELYEIAARSAACGELRLHDVVPKGSLSARILDSVFNVVSRTASTTASAALLLKTGYALDVTSIGPRIVGFWSLHSKNEHQLGTRRFRSCVCTRLTPWCDYRSGRSGKSPLQSKFALAYPGSPTAQLHNVGPQAVNNLPQEREIKFRARILEGEHLVAGALQLYRDLRRVSGNRKNIVQVATAGVVRNLISEGDFVAAADEIVDAYLLEPSLLWGELEGYISVVIGQLLESPARNKGMQRWGWPLLLQICFDLTLLEPDAKQLYGAYDDELRKASANRPSDLLSANPDNRFIAFLRVVCVGDVLRRSYRFKSLSERETERLLILQYLLLHDPNGREAYTNEIAMLTQKAMLRNAVRHVEASRIYVNTEGIHRSLGADHEVTFQRFVRIIAIEDEKLRKQLRLDQFNDLKFDIVLTFVDMGYTLFLELFRRIRDAFVSSKADGLNTYLSMRIRHGTLSGTLRGQFEKLNLVARRETARGEYARNDYWTERLTVQSHKITGAIEESLRTFSMDVDSIIEEVNNSWIRVRGDQHTDGMFDYAFDDEQLRIIYTAIVSSGPARMSYHGFVDECLTCLWARTDELLGSIRERLEGELAERLSTALAKADGSVKSAWRGAAQSDLGFNLAAARTSITRDTHAVAQWFTIPTQRTMQPFGFQTLVDTASEMVRRIHPGHLFRPQLVESLGTSAPQLRGDCFTPLFNIYFILFDNIVQHGSENDTMPYVEIILKDGWLDLVTTNVVSSQSTPHQLDETIQTLNSLKEMRTEDLRVEAEGRSGFEKLHNILRNDLRREPYEIVVTRPTDDTFRVRVRFPASDLITEGAK